MCRVSDDDETSGGCFTGKNTCNLVAHHQGVSVCQIIWYQAQVTNETSAAAVDCFRFMFSKIEAYSSTQLLATRMQQ
jgi:hypothetical protein